MTPGEVERLRVDPTARRALEARSFLFAIRPLAFDLAGTLAFYLVFATTGSLVAATLLGVALGVGQIAAARWRGEAVSPVQTAGVWLVFVVGVATLVLHDARIVLYQVGVAYLVVGAAMLKPGWMWRYLPPVARAHVPERLSTRFGFAWAALILGTGGFNLWLTAARPPASAAATMAAWAIPSKLALFAVQYSWLGAVTRRGVRRALAGEDQSPGL